MNILFIGGTGNISTACAARLHRQGHDITVLTRGASPIPPEYTACRADRHDRAAVEAALAQKDIDIVLDFIAYDVPDVTMDWELFQGRIRQYVFISTTVVYSRPPEKLPFTETSPLGNRFSEYGRKKLACEEFLRRQCRENGFPVTIVRPSHTYSNRWMPNPVTSVGYTVAARLEQGRPVFVHDDGQGLWTLTHTEDFAAGLAGLIGNEDAIGEAVQITSDCVLTWNQVMAETCRALEVDAPDIVHIPTEFIAEAEPVMAPKLKGDKAHHGVFDNAKIKRLVPDFECKIPFREGIRRSVEWFRQDPRRQAVNPEVDAIFDRVIERWRESGMGEA